MEQARVDAPLRLDADRRGWQFSRIHLRRASPAARAPRGLLTPATHIGIGSIGIGRALCRSCSRTRLCFKTTAALAEALHAFGDDVAVNRVPRGIVEIFQKAFRCCRRLVPNSRGNTTAYCLAIFPARALRMPSASAKPSLSLSSPAGVVETEGVALVLEDRLRKQSGSVGLRAVDVIYFPRFGNTHVSR